MAPKVVNRNCGAPANAAVTGRDTSAYFRFQPSRRAGQEPVAPAEIHRAADLRADHRAQELVVCAADAEVERLSTGLGGRRLRAGEALQPGERRDEGHRRAAQRDAIAALELAEELVGTRQAPGAGALL